MRAANPAAEPDIDGLTWFGCTLDRSSVTTSVAAHTLRHTFGTHAALFGVNPWRLQSWMGHKRIDETMIYVHVAENHRREIPESVVAAAATELDPDRRILKMLAARGSHVAANSVASKESPKNLAS